jgi:lipoyl(octanoyl) transferase
MSRDAWLLTPGRVRYGLAYDAMHDLAARRAAGDIPDVLILLEHPPVFTAGRRTDPAHLLLTRPDIERLGAEIHEVDRGGSVTFHGPGQLVGYPILDLGPAPDVLGYLRKVEDAVIRAGRDVGVDLERNRDTGVWAGDKKVCALGVRVSRGITLHGFALNCNTDLSWYGAIVPCGLEDRGVTSLTELAGREVTVEDAEPLVTRAFEEVFGLTFSAAPSAIQELLHPATSDASVAVAGG